MAFLLQLANCFPGNRCFFHIWWFSNRFTSPERAPKIRVSDSNKTRDSFFIFIGFSRVFLALVAAFLLELFNIHGRCFQFDDRPKKPGVINGLLKTGTSERQRERIHFMEHYYYFDYHLALVSSACVSRKNRSMWTAFKCNSQKHIERIFVEIVVGLSIKNMPI